MDLFDLVINQMRYQNPLEPASASEFLSELMQVAGLSELRSTRLQIDAIKEGIRMLSQRSEDINEGARALSMLGSWVEYKACDNTGGEEEYEVTRFGLVESVILESPPMLVVRDKDDPQADTEVCLLDVTQVFARDPR
jgi:hypothetical protein